jgi:signal transduction histidine kinase
VSSAGRARPDGKDLIETVGGRKPVPQASHSDDELRDRIAHASHDLGNLLGVVLNYSTLLARQLKDPVMLADIGHIRVAAERAADIARSLARTEPGDDRRGDA